MSHPAWVCGLKPTCKTFNVCGFLVTPCVGVWIETIERRKLYGGVRRSHPAWVCGLKPFCSTMITRKLVTPCVGVWIETDKGVDAIKEASHTLRGCVD